MEMCGISPLRSSLNGAFAPKTVGEFLFCHWRCEGLTQLTHSLCAAADSDSELLAAVFAMHAVLYPNAQSHNGAQLLDNESAC